MGAPIPPLASGLADEAIAARLAAHAGAERDPASAHGLCLAVDRARLREAVLLLRDDPALAFAQLLDIAGVDYLTLPGHRGPRFAVVYLLKSVRFRHRVRLKVRLEEADPALPSIHDLYPVADWHERETWDQYGIVFTGHPGLRRLLNHHEFQGHPLRKDYPCQRRQKLSASDPMLDQLEARLRARGYEVVASPSVAEPERITAPPGSRP